MGYQAPVRSTTLMKEVCGYVVMLIDSGNHINTQIWGADALAKMAKPPAC